MVKTWLMKNFLPLWAKETVLRDNKMLKEENTVLRQKVCELEQYIRGIHMGLRGRRNG